jgi:catechol 2,3-dioxygenase-like lactoylglutathione lyase family enzyme
MRIRRAMPVVVTDDPGASRAFYESVLGFRVAMEQDGMLMFASRTTPTTQLIVAWHSPSAPDPEVCTVDLSIEVDDVDAAYRSARAGGLEIVRELRDEAWGIRRFFVRDPAGAVVNVASHLVPPVDRDDEGTDRGSEETQ